MVYNTVILININFPSCLGLRTIFWVEKEVDDVGQNFLTFLEIFFPSDFQWYTTSHTQRTTFFDQDQDQILGGQVKNF